MTVINLTLKQIDKAAIDSLVENEARESRTLDFKEKLPGNGADDRSEFLKDVSSMANAAGGDLVYGVAERREGGKNTGIADSVVGLGPIKADGEILRLHNMLRDGLDPRLNGVQIHPVEGFDLGPVLVLRVPKSYHSPHMVKAGESRFYSRNDAGKYPLDSAQIRSAYALSDSLPEKIRRFRDERLGRIVADEMPVPLDRNVKAVLHLVPFSALEPAAQVDVSAYHSRYLEFALARTGSVGPQPRYNFDGILIPGTDWSYIQKNASYVQIYRTGALELVDNEILHTPFARTPDQLRYLTAAVHEKFLIVELKKYLKILEYIGVQPPISVMLSLVGAKGYGLIVTDGSGDSFSLHAIDRDMLMLPDGLVQSYEDHADLILKPAFDALWQSVGYERDRFYRESNQGRWGIRRGQEPIV